MSNQLPVILRIHGDKISEVNFSTSVAGTTFVKNSDSLLRFLKSKVPRHMIQLHLIPEPENEVDPNAVRIEIGLKGSSQQVKIGYLPADRAELVSYVLSHPLDYDVLIHDINLFGGEPNKPNIGLFFTYNILKR